MVHLVHFVDKAERSRYGSGLKSEFGNLECQMKGTSCAMICVFHNAEN